MPLIGITGVSRVYDGEYELDTDIAFSSREWRWVKQIARYGPTDIGDGFRATDPDLYTALAVIAMHRAGKIERDQVLDVADLIADVPFEFNRTITIVDTAEEQAETEADASPPEPTSEPAESSESRPLEKRNGSGQDSRSGSEQLAETPEPTGTTKSPTSATLAGTT